MDNRTYLITGGSSGIGKAIGEKVVDKGHNAIVFDKKSPDYNSQFFKTDIRNKKEIKKSVNELDTIDVLVNNAGVYKRTPVDEFNEDSFYDIFDTNVKGYRLVYTHLLPFLKDSEDGNVVNVSSGLGKRPEPYSDLYSASKAAIIAMSISWANNYEKTGVRSNCVLPGPVKTSILSENFTEDELDEYKKLQPMKKFLEPTEVAESILTLSLNDFYNGACLEVGGESNNNQYGL